MQSNENGLVYVVLAEPEIRARKGWISFRIQMGRWLVMVRMLFAHASHAGIDFSCHCDCSCRAGQPWKAHLPTDAKVCSTCD